MKTMLISIVMILALGVANGTSAQQPPAGHQHDQAQPPGQSAPGPQRGGMMGGMPGGGMMGGMHGGGMHGGMMGGGMCGMMGGMGGMMMGNPSDPKTLSRMLQMRGEIMKAVGDVLIKHGQALETAPAR
jgi:hypothetical protein